MNKWICALLWLIYSAFGAFVAVTASGIIYWVSITRHREVRRRTWRDIASQLRDRRAGKA